MNTTVAMTIAIVAVLAVAVWQGAATSVLFARSGRERWRGWLPIVREIELFRWGRQPPYAVALLFIPLVSIYALVLYALALRRIGRRWGLPAGFAVLGALLPPVWATIVAVRSAGVDGAGDDVDGTTGGGLIAARTGKPSRVPKPAREPKPPRVRKPRPAKPARPAKVKKASPPAPTPRSPFAPPEQTAPVAGYDLLVFGGPRIPLTADRAVFGRSPRSEDPRTQLVPLTDPSATMSGSHAEIFLVEDQWFVTDLGSRAGVIVHESDERSPHRRANAGETVPVTGEMRAGAVRLLIRPRGQ